MSILDAIKGDVWRIKWSKLPEMELRQSSVRDFRYCPAQYNFKRTSESNSKLPDFFFFGSMFHSLCENMLMGIDFNPDWLIEELFMERDYELGGLSIKDISNRLWDKDIFYGDSVMDLVDKSIRLISSAGITYEPSSIEKMVGFKLGKVTFSGTPDFVGELAGDGVILDFKTSGLSGRFFRNGSISSTSFKKFQISYSTQLQHYDWLMYRTSGLKAKYYGYILPANLTINTRTNKMRGDPLQMAEAPDLDSLLHSYEDDLYGTAKEIAECIDKNHWTRRRPEVFGKLDCVRCAYKDSCLGQRTIRNIPKWMK